MSGANPFLDADALRASTFLRRVELHDTLPSTNDRAKQLAATADLETPALVATRLQTAGRGRGANTWWSADGALTFSLVLDTPQWGISSRDWPRLSLTTAVAVCDALVDEAPQSSIAIKWPNDVLLDGAKVSGILIESPGGTSPTKDRLIIGVGINVNNSFRGAPDDLRTTGVALCDATGKQHDGPMVLVRFLNALEIRLQQLAAKNQALPQAWQQRCWLTGQVVEATVEHRSIAGGCLGITDDGALLVQTSIAIEHIYSGAVQVSPT